MGLNKNIVAFSAAFAILAAPWLGAAEAKPKIKTHHRHFVNKSSGCPVRQIADGSLVDCHGWRKWSGTIGWDNTCLHLDYLDSQFACTSPNGEH
ncbi:MAG: hypothetical protein WBX25_13335 [Rhodomicrobium sp.]